MPQVESKQVSFAQGCMNSLRKLPDRVQLKFMEMMSRYMDNPSLAGLNLETVEGGRDRTIKSLRVDGGYRAIAVDAERDILFVHVNEHDKAYRWASNRKVKVDFKAKRIRIFQEEVSEQFQPEQVNTNASEIMSKNLFDDVSDKRLLALMVNKEELNLIRKIVSIPHLEQFSEEFDPLTYNVLLGLAMGMSDEEIFQCTGAHQPFEPKIDTQNGNESFGQLIQTDQSRQSIFIPESEEELRRFFDGKLEGWRVFLHPQQRNLAYRDYNGPALIRGGAGTGKTVVAMHRAKFLADQIKIDQDSHGQRVLVTTFTTNLTKDIETNLMTLCPEHLESTPPRIEVVYLDRWVTQYLKTKGYEKSITFSAHARERVSEIWNEVFEEFSLPDGLTEEFVKSEWESVIQAKGISDKDGYLSVLRTGRGTALNRGRRIELWNIFSEVRMRMEKERLAEREDAYREAAEMIKADVQRLPYRAVIVDEAQDMGEQAFKLIRVIMDSSAKDEKNVIFIVGDAHQRIYNQKASMSECGISIVGRSRRLRLNYRTSHEIRTWAVSILDGVAVDDLDQGNDTLDGYVSLFRGPKPEFIQCESKNEELDGLRNWVIEMQGSGIQISDIGILTSTNTFASLVAEDLTMAGIENLQLKTNVEDDRSIPGVRVSTMHRSKGLEFFAVAIPFLTENTYPSKSALKSAVDDAEKEETINRFRCLLHVASTRAKKALRISWHGKPTKLINFNDERN